MTDERKKKKKAHDRQLIALKFIVIRVEAKPDGDCFVALLCLNYVQSFPLWLFYFSSTVITQIPARHPILNDSHLYIMSRAQEK